MMRWLSIAERGVLTVIVGLSVVAATPAAAQQAAGSGAPAVAASAGPVVPNPVAEARAAATMPTAADARAAQAGTQGAPLLGPRLRPQVQSVEPRVARRTPALSAAAARGNTIVISTLALVLIAVIVTILVVK
jgi:hypothetical protein